MVDQASAWEFDDEEQKRKFNENITKSNCGEKLKLVRDISGISRRELARTLAVSEATVRRIETKESEPTDKFMSRVQALCVLGQARFGKMSEAEKEKISEFLGASGGAVAGIGGALGAVSAVGAVGGLSAAGMTSGLATLGLGSMATGIGVVAAIPIGVGLGGYGLVKGIKAICEEWKLDVEEIDGKWEIRTRADTETA